MKVPILMYHSVGGEAAGGPRGYRITPRRFEEHLSFLRERGMETVSLANLLDWRSGKNTLPSGAVVLTFDDGYYDNYSHALPLLRKHGFRAAFFLTASTVGKPGMMGKREVETLLAEGMEVGSHGWGHLLLGGKSEDFLLRELEASRRRLSLLLRREIDFFSLPRGYLPPRFPLLARRAGYRGMCTSIVGYNTAETDPFRWRRFPLRSGVGLSRFKAVVSRRESPLGGLFLMERLRGVLRRRYRFGIFRPPEV